MSGIVIGEVSFTDQWKTGVLYWKQLYIPDRIYTTAATEDILKQYRQKNICSYCQNCE